MKRVGTNLEISNAIQGNSASPRPAECFTGPDSFKGNFTRSANDSKIRHKTNSLPISHRSTVNIAAYKGYRGAHSPLSKQVKTPRGYRSPTTRVETYRM